MYIVNVEAAIRQGDKWLVIQRGFQEEHAAGMLSLVGGKVDEQGASMRVLEQTLLREVEEEVGLHVEESMYYVMNTSFCIGEDIRVINIVFLCKVAPGEAYAKSGEEVEAVTWLTTEEILTSEQAPSYLKDSIAAAEQVYQLIN